MMREVLLSDVIAAARVLRVLPGRRWGMVMRHLVSAASEAARHRRETGRAHPNFGDGSLMGVALRLGPPPEPALSDRVYRDALVFVLMMAGAYPRAQDRQSGTEGSA